MSAHKVFILTSDETTFAIEKDVLKECKYFDSVLPNAKVTEFLPVEVNHSTMMKVLEYLLICRNASETTECDVEFFNRNEHMLDELYQAAKFLGSTRLMHGCYMKKVFSRMRAFDGVLAGPTNKHTKPVIGTQITIEQHDGADHANAQEPQRKKPVGCESNTSLTDAVREVEEMNFEKETP